MIGSVQMYALIGIGVLLFGKSLIIKGVKDFVQLKKEVNEAVKNEDGKEKKEE